VTDFRDELSPKDPRYRSPPEKWAGSNYLDEQWRRSVPFKFLQEVRAEGQKVTWPTRKETTVTTMMVFVMVFVASIFFLLADQIMRIGVGFLLGINS
jgi:preprotein translocase subunit SecE